MAIGQPARLLIRRIRQHASSGSVAEKGSLQESALVPHDSRGCGGALCQLVKAIVGRRVMKALQRRGTPPARCQYRQCLRSPRWRTTPSAAQLPTRMHPPPGVSGVPRLLTPSEVHNYAGQVYAQGRSSLGIRASFFSPFTRRACISGWSTSSCQSCGNLGLCVYSDNSQSGAILCLRRRRQPAQLDRSQCLFSVFSPIGCDSGTGGASCAEGIAQAGRPPPKQQPVREQS